MAKVDRPDMADRGDKVRETKPARQTDAGPGAVTSPLWGTPERIREVAKEFRVYYEKVPAGKSYTVDHTALTYIYDPEGRLRLAMGHRQTTEHYIADLRKLMSPGA